MAERPLDLLLISAYFPPDTGSAAHLFHELATALTARGHRVSVATGMPGYHAQGSLDHYRGQVVAREELDGIDVIRAATPAWLRNSRLGRAAWQILGAIAIIAAAARLPRHDAVLVYSPPLPLAWATTLLGRLKKMPVIVNVQDLFPRSAVDLGLVRHPLLIRALEAVERSVYRRANHLTVHSPSNRDHLVTTGAAVEKVSVQPNWVDTDLIAPGERANSFRHKHGLGDRFVVSFAGVLGYSQDLGVVLEAAERTKDRADIAWLIVGDGVERDRIGVRAQTMGLDTLTFLPMLAKTDYVELLQASDAGLVTLRAEVATPVVPSKILSIMSAGVPVLAALPPGDAPALIRDASAGVCVEAGDAEALAASARELADDRALAAKLGAEGRRYAAEHLSLASAARAYEHLVESLQPAGRAT